MNWIIALAGYNPQKEGRKPIVQKKEQKRTIPKLEALPNNVRLNTISKKLEKKTVEIGGSTIWENVQRKNDFDNRSSELNKEEKEFLETTRNMSVSKGEILKPLWSDGLKPKEAAHTFNERGFSYETVRKYWTIFNRFISSIERQEGLREG